MDTALIVVICLMIAFCVAVVICADLIESRYHKLHPPDEEVDDDDDR